ncbi:MAG: MIP family channel protein [Pirellulaceae bacterium]|nr:MIP family channel protein [Pirellulaceae bacterium]
MNVNLSTGRLLFAEFLATFVLVFMGTGAVVVGAHFPGAFDHLGVAMAFGLAVMCMIYAVGDISGAHMNPAVTIAFWVGGRFPAIKVFPYCISQCLGAASASFFLWGVFPKTPTLGATVPTEGLSDMGAGLIEFLLTFFLMLVILRVSTGAKEKGITAAIAIGSFVALEALVFGNVTGASMNPARSFGPALCDWLVSSDSSTVEPRKSISVLWGVYWLAPIVGAATAVYVERFLSGQK